MRILRWSYEKLNFQSEFNVYIGVKIHLLRNILVANLFLYVEYFVNYKQLICTALFVNSLFSAISNYILIFLFVDCHLQTQLSQNVYCQETYFFSKYEKSITSFCFLLVLFFFMTLSKIDFQDWFDISSADKHPSLLSFFLVLYSPFFIWQRGVTFQFE